MIAASGGAATTRRRPKDRKAQVERAAAAAFSSHGYHAVSMEAIAAKVGISAPALYRHYPSKYDLFRNSVLDLGQQLDDATAFIDSATPLAHVLHALVDVTLANRESGGLYRWEARYLQPGDRAVLANQLRTVNHRIQLPLSVYRPELSSSDQWMLSTGVLSVIGSIVDHRVRMPDDDIRSLLLNAGTAVLAAELPSSDEPSPLQPRLFSDSGPYEALLHAAMMLFYDKGYRETRIEQIASAVGIPASGVYRYFSGKSEILATAMRRAADRVSGELSMALGADTEPRIVLGSVVEAYVAISFANPELASVYYAERVNLPPADQVLLRNVQRSTIDSWVRLLTSARPSVSSTQVRFLVHAAMALVVDIGRLVRYQHSQACVRKLMELTLFDS
jgi:AcrR family transcriptional regulator